MGSLPTSIIYTQDAVTLQRIRGYLHARSVVKHVNEPDTLELFLCQHPDSLVFLDLCGNDALSLVRKIKSNFPNSLIIALGAARSAPALRAASIGVYAVESETSDRLRLQSLFDQAQAHLHLCSENRILRESIQNTPLAPEPARENIAPSLYHFSSAFRRFDNLGIMLESIVEGIANCARVSRVSIFSITPTDVYSFRSGIKCLEETRTLEFKKTHPFVQWLQLHAHSISRSMLRHIETVKERLLIEQMLEQTGAEAILPLFGRERLIGWLCLGRPSCGAPFDQRDIEELTQLAEQISVTIENSLLHEHLALQKAMAENLLQAVPIGIIATGADGEVRWFNQGAEHLLNVAAEDHIGRPVERLSGYIASLINQAVAGDSLEDTIEWIEPITHRELAIQICRLRQNEQCVGAMAILRDLTEERILRERQNNLERATFWNELATAISHEVRNPLVAISTFSQLLPERYADEEFRTQFRDLTTQEVSRLNGMIDQLDEYANLPELSFNAVDVATLVDSALRKSLPETDLATSPVHVDFPADLPPIHADINILSDSIAHLLKNSIRAVEGVSQPKIDVTASCGEIGMARPAVMIQVQDNGCGISEDLQPKVFSPFCTTKTRGIGLGLPIVRRTMIDHGGLISIDSSTNGTTVTLSLPVAEGKV